MPRATTAACEVMPPVRVSTARAACMPWMSSGLVSARTRITDSPALPRRTASSASNTMRPLAAPGDAGSPRASRVFWRIGIDLRMEELVGELGLDPQHGSIAIDQPSPTISTATRSAASAVRFALRVCSTQSFPSCDRELDVLQVAEVALQPFEHGAELAMDLGHRLFERRHRATRRPRPDRDGPPRRDGAAPECGFPPPRPRPARWGATLPSRAARRSTDCARTRRRCPTARRGCRTPSPARWRRCPSYSGMPCRPR